MRIPILYLCITFFSCSAAVSGGQTIAVCAGGCVHRRVKSLTVVAVDACYGVEVPLDIYEAPHLMSSTPHLNPDFDQKQTYALSGEQS